MTSQAANYVCLEIIQSDGIARGGPFELAKIEILS